MAPRRNKVLRAAGFLAVAVGFVLVWMRLGEKRVVWAAERLLWESTEGNTAYWADIWDDEEEELF
jgi:hypothetical protein